MNDYLFKVTLPVNGGIRKASVHRFALAETGVVSWTVLEHGHRRIIVKPKEGTGGKSKENSAVEFHYFTSKKDLQAFLQKVKDRELAEAEECQRVLSAPFELRVHEVPSETPLGGKIKL